MIAETLGVLTLIGQIGAGIAGIEKGYSVIVEGKPIINTERFQTTEEKKLKAQPCKCPGVKGTKKNVRPNKQGNL